MTEDQARASSAKLGTSLAEALQTSSAAPATTVSNESVAPPATQRHPAPPQERAARIWRIIQEWNNTPNRPQFEKVALTASTLEKRFGIFRPIAQQFLTEYHAEIAAHTQAHAITALNHNRGVPDRIWEILKQRSAEAETEKQIPQRLRTL